MANLASLTKETIMSHKLYFLAGKLGFVVAISQKGYISYTSNIREAKVFNSFEDADTTAKSTHLGKGYFAILSPSIS